MIAPTTAVARDARRPVHVGSVECPVADHLRARSEDLTGVPRRRRRRGKRREGKANDRHNDEHPHASNQYSMGGEGSKEKGME